MVVDEAELGVQRHVLGQVPGGVVRLGAEHRPGLVDPLEDADHRLLVELRGLGQVGRAPEVVHAEHAGAGLGGRRHELRRLDLGEAECVQRGPEAAQRRGGQLPARPPGRMPPGHGGVVQDRGQPGVDRGPPYVDRRGLRGLAEQRDPGFGHLDAAGRGPVARGHAGDRDDALLSAAPHRSQGLRLTDDHLSQARTVSQDEERHRTERPAAVHPALDQDRAAGNGRWQLGSQRAGKASQRGCQGHHLQFGVALEVRAGARSRCHRTFAGVSRPRRPLRGRRPGLGRCLHRRPAVRLRSCRRLSERRDSPVTRSSVITRT